VGNGGARGRGEGASVPKGAMHMNGKHWRYWLPHDSSSDAFQLIMLFSGATQTVWEGVLLKGSTVMGRRYLEGGPSYYALLRGHTDCLGGGPAYDALFRGST
jgi:hypothetical protein